MSRQFHFDAEDRKIDDVIFENSKYKFRIPRYQRPYSWTKDHVDDLWNDITSADEPYFIGSFVFNIQNLEAEGVIDIVDGQQRLMTLTMFMAAVRDTASQVVNDEDLAKRIQNHCVAVESKSGDESFKLEPCESIRPFFEAFIQRKDGDKPQPITKEETAVRDNFSYLMDKLKDDLDLISGAQKKSERLIELWTNLGSAKAIWIEIADDEYAYEVFETVNARGADLTVADLLKQLILKNDRQLGHGKDVAVEKWTDIEKNISDAGVELSKFIRHYWLSRFSFVSEKRLYRDVKDKVKDYKSLLNDLKSASQDYYRLHEGNEEDWSAVDHGADIYESMIGLRAMQVTQCYVLMICLLRNQTKIPFRIDSYFRKIENFSFNYFCVGKRPANKIEKLYSAAALEIENEIRQNDAKNLGKNVQRTLNVLMSKLEALKLDKDSFASSFKKISYKNSEQARVVIKYILARLDLVMGRSDEHMLNFSSVNIEHLLPQKPEKWGLTPRDIKDYVHLIGNLTLLSGKINSGIGQETIINKLPKLEESQIHITKDVVEEIKTSGAIWNSETIEKRGTKLASLAWEAWKI